MESKTDSPKLPKLPDMVMCGDHPSFTKTELNAREPRDKLLSHDRIPASLSQTFTPMGSGSRAGSAHAAAEQPARLESRRRARSLDAVPSPGAAPSSQALVQAALGSFRWPPYLLVVWMLVLVLTHALHCLVGVLEQALPRLKQLSQYFRGWTQDAWQSEHERLRLRPALLALLTASLYSAYFGLYSVYSVAVWAIEPLCTELEDKAALEATVTEYEEEINSKTDVKQ